MANNLATLRLRKEFKHLNDDPVPDVIAFPIEKNILEWRFVLKGSHETDYVGGYYHGKLKFPSEYPFAPPSILMITPSGRFVVNSRICFSMSDFHPESWCPSWSVGTILTALLSFMNSDEQTTGSMEASSDQRKEFARLSKEFNNNDKLFREVFGDTDAVERRFVEIDTKISSKVKAISCAPDAAAISVKSSSHTSVNSVTSAVSNLVLASPSSSSMQEKDVKGVEAIRSETTGPSSDQPLSKSAKKRARKKKVAERSSQETGVDGALGDLDDGENFEEEDKDASKDESR